MILDERYELKDFGFKRSHLIAHKILLHDTKQSNSERHFNSASTISTTTMNALQDPCNDENGTNVVVNKAMKLRRAPLSSRQGNVILSNTSSNSVSFCLNRARACLFFLVLHRKTVEKAIIFHLVRVIGIKFSFAEVHMKIKPTSHKPICYVFHLEPTQQHDTQLSK